MEIEKILKLNLKGPSHSIQYSKKKVFSSSVQTLQLVREKKITKNCGEYALAVRHFVADLTTIQGSHMKAIRLHEFTHLAWTDQKNNKQNSPNILAVIEQTTKLSKFVSVQILSIDTSPLQRAGVMGFWIDVASGCAQCGNFNSAMAIYSGLNMAEILRLKQTQTFLSKEHQEKYRELEVLFSMEKKFRELSTRGRDFQRHCSFTSFAGAFIRSHFFP